MDVTTIHDEKCPVWPVEVVACSNRSNAEIDKMFLQFTVESLRRCWGVYSVERVLPCISPLQLIYRNIKYEFIKKVR